jgi:hypothetical protein
LSGEAGGTSGSVATEDVSFDNILDSSLTTMAVR